MIRRTRDAAPIGSCQAAAIFIAAGLSIPETPFREPRRVAGSTRRAAATTVAKISSAPSRRNYFILTFYEFHIEGYTIMKCRKQNLFQMNHSWKFAGDVCLSPLISIALSATEFPSPIPDFCNFAML
jgi:hypothetical protein